MISVCNLCGGGVKIFHPTDIYGVGYKHFGDSKEAPGKAISYIYKCLKCGASVGCHGDTTKPFGTLADKKTKNARHLCHELLDPLRKCKKDGNHNKGSRGKERKRLYRLLSKHMGISYRKTHFGMFDIEQCRIAYKFFLKYKIDNNIK